MRRYLDTSLVVAALIREPGTEAAKVYLSSIGDGFMLATRWTATEFSSALAAKVRLRHITEEEQTAALAMFRRFTASRLRLMDIEARDFDTAAALCDQSSTPLRVGDALHLAACKRTRARLVTFDVGLAAAAKAHSVPCDLLVCQHGPSK